MTLSISFDRLCVATHSLVLFDLSPCHQTLPIRQPALLPPRLLLFTQPRLAMILWNLRWTSVRFNTVNIFPTMFPLITIATCLLFLAIVSGDFTSTPLSTGFNDVRMSLPNQACQPIVNVLLPHLSGWGYRRRWGWAVARIEFFNLSYRARRWFYRPMHSAVL